MGKRVDLIGKKFNLLTVVSYKGKSKWGYSLWQCLCECGEIAVVSSGNLNTGGVKSCGCLMVRNSGVKKDLTGLVFGRLSVLREASKRWKGDKVYWRCLCTCGQETVVGAGDLQSGHTKSCGCLALDVRTTHGLSKHPLKSVWKDMKRRCYNKKCRSYVDYGGRGISVCEEWRLDFLFFYHWATENGWRKGLLLDRENNDGDYSPSNCRFLNRQESAQNTRLLSKRNVSGYRGVSPTRGGKFKSYYTYKTKLTHLGTYPTAKEAAQVRDAAVISAKLTLPLNFIHG